MVPTQSISEDLEKKSLFSKNACDRCRSRRIFCSKEKSSCKQCILVQQECVYTFIPKRRGPMKGSRQKHQRDRGGEILIKSLTSTHFEPKLGYQLVTKSTNPNQAPVLLDNTPIKVYDNQHFENIRRKVTGRLSLSYLETKFGMIKTLFDNSVMDSKQKVLIRDGGSLDYFGESPMGLLLTMYVVHHSKPNELNQLHKSLKVPPKAILPPLTKTYGLPDLLDLGSRTHLVEQCVQAYFEYFHPQLPLVNRTSILTNFSSHAPTLTNLIISIGSGYLPQVDTTIRDHFSDLAIDQLKSSYLKPSLDNVSALLLMANFQHNPKDCSKGFFSLGYAIRMSYLLGLDRPANFRCSEATRELRNRLWWYCHILDKLYGFGMNRPYFHDFRFSTRPFPKFLKSVDLVPNDAETFQFKMYCSCTYTRLIGEFCQLLYLMVRKFKFSQIVKPNQLDETISLAKATAKHLHLMFQKIQVTFQQLIDPTEDLDKENMWKQKVIDPFQNNLNLIYHATLIQLYRTFSKTPTSSTTKFSHSEFHKLATISADQAIDIAYAMNQDFYLYGTTYRFYALGNAVFYQIFNATSKDLKVKSNALHQLKRALQIFQRSKAFYALGTESLHMSLLLAKAEHLDLEKEFYQVA